MQQMMQGQQQNSNGAASLPANGMLQASQQGGMQ